MAEKIDAEFSDDELVRLIVTILSLSHEERNMLLSYAKTFKSVAADNELRLNEPYNKNKIKSSKTNDKDKSEPTKLDDNIKRTYKKSSYKAEINTMTDCNLFPEERSFIQERDRRIFEEKLSEIRRDLQEISEAVTELRVFLNCGAFFNGSEENFGNGSFRIK